MAAAYYLIVTLLALPVMTLASNILASINWDLFT